MNIDSTEVDYLATEYIEELNKELHAFIDRVIIPVRRRQIFKDYYLSGMKQKDIAAKHGCLQPSVARDVSLGLAAIMKRKDELLELVSEYRSTRKLINDFDEQYEEDIVTDTRELSIYKYLNTFN